MTGRTAQLTRTTGETDVALALGLDGSGDGARVTGVGFLDHMLDLVARHGGVRATGDVDRAGGARLVHGDHRVAVAGDAAAVAERAVERLAEHDPRVLGGVVRAGVQVPRDAHLEVEPAVAREQVEHVVEEPHARRPRAGAGSVQAECERDVGLPRRAGHLRGAGHRGARFSRISIDAAWCSKPSARAMGAPARASAPAARPTRTSAIRRRKWRGESPEANRAAPPVGSVWLEPAT